MIYQITPQQCKSLISQHLPDIIEEDVAEMCEAAERSRILLVGLHKEKLLFISGFVPGSALSDTVYAWLLPGGGATEYPTIFGRHTFAAVRKIRTVYPRMVGICLKDNLRSKAWLERLGAKMVDHTPISWRFEL